MASEQAAAAGAETAKATATVHRELPRGLRSPEVKAVWGNAVCRGIGRGVAVHVSGLSLPPHLRTAKAASTETELASARAAFAAVTADLRTRASAAHRKFEKDLLAAHAGIAEDPALRTEVEHRVRAGETAAQAVVGAAQRFIDKLREAQSAYIRDRVVDIQDVCMQVVDHLARGGGGKGGGTGGEHSATEIALDRDSILVADVLTANQLLRLNQKLLKGLVLGSVGATSHTVILARSLRIPTLLDAHDAQSAITAGDELIVDGDRGLALNTATPAVGRYYELQERTNRRRLDRLAPVITRTATTRDGARMEIGVNASTPNEVTAAVGLGAEGVGLLRTELLFLDRQTAPTEEEQFEAYAAVVRAAEGRPVIIRTFDIGGDKPAAYMNIPQEENPFLGCRGIRLYPLYPDMLRGQLRAIVRASAIGPVKVMAPMVALPSEAEWFKAKVRETQEQLRTEGVKFDDQMPVGVMVEVPSMALSIGDLRGHADFVSLGTNDLCQYWMAADRGNKSVAALNRSRHPSFLRLLTQIASSAREAGIWIGVCGEMAGDRANLPLLVGMGMNEISAAPGEVLNLKAALGSFDSTRCRDLLAAAMACRTVEEVETTLQNPAYRSTDGAGILDSCTIQVGSDARSKEEAIKEAVDTLFVAGRTERPQAVEEAVWAREATYSTGLGYGFAVPHCKTDAVTVPTLAAIKLQSPIDWGSSDGQPVGVVLLLAIPAADTTGAHMKVFAKLARKLMHEEFRDRLNAAADSQAIEQTLREELQIQ
ncbi:MAG: phosphoenolpyruvate--protein phosphotransferase [Phycisphaerales bacterium]